MQNAKPNPNGYIYKTFTPEAKGPMYIQGHKDCKNQRIRESAV